MIQPQPMPGGQPASSPASPRPETPSSAPAESGVYREAFDASGQPRDHWAPILSAFDLPSPDTMKQRRSLMQRMRRDHGAAYNPFGDAGDGVGPWELDMIPLPLSAGDWDTVEAGLIQRARLLNLILADVYGPRNLLRERRMPPEMVFANPSFSRACHGMEPPERGLLSFYGADVYRGADGRWRVIAEFARNPVGLGFALENRIVISRVFSHIYHRHPVQRLAPFFSTLRQSLAESAVTHRDDPRIVILTPGPENPTYFEHAFLAQYLGFPLVESEDLTVRNARVYLKKLGGLDPVDVILRYLPDQDSDPLAMRGATTDGVAGLIQAMREGNVAVVNPVGAGFADTPALQTLLPDLCRYLLGEDLILEGHPTRWGGGPSSLMDKPEGLIFRPAFGPGPALVYDLLSEAEKTALRADIGRRPYAYIASPPVFPSLAPGWTENGPADRPTVPRHFVSATEEGFTVMPGGLARTFTESDAVWNPGLGGRGCADVWILSETPVKPFTLLRRLKPVADFNRASDLPSRVADHFLWLGRYLERAEGALRRVRAVYRRLSGEFKWLDMPELPFLLEVLVEGATIPPDVISAGRDMNYAFLEKELLSAILPREGLENIWALLQKVRYTARNVKDRLSPDAWRVITGLTDMFGETAPGSEPVNEALELLNDTLCMLSAFSGLAQESVTRGLGWRFMDMGRRVERGLNQIQLIRIGLPKACADLQNLLETLLEVSDSLMTYRARYRAVYQLAPVLDLLLVDEANPRSLAFQLKELSEHIHQLPRTGERRFSTPEERLSLKMLTATRLIDLMSLECGNPETEREKEAEMSQFLGTLESDLEEFADRVTAHYLSRIPTTSHYSLAERR